MCAIRATRNAVQRRHRKTRDREWKIDDERDEKRTAWASGQEGENVRKENETDPRGPPLRHPREVPLTSGDQCTAVFIFVRRRRAVRERV